MSSSEYLALGDLAVHFGWTPRFVERLATGGKLPGVEVNVERETLCSTALPGGVAICHPRRPVPHIVRKTLLAVLRTGQPVPFGAEDGESTRLFFLIAAKDDRAHLHALARGDARPSRPGPRGADARRERWGIEFCDKKSRNRN
ncbi:MAG: PTS sugar transporter subunit IIA [Opitutaceae bacterium]